MARKSRKVVVKRKSVAPVEEVVQSKKKEDGPKEHKFWNTQLVPTDAENDGGPIETKMHCPILPGEEIIPRPEPYNMPGGFEWSDIDIDDPKHRSDLADLLRNHYVGSNGPFPFDYSEDQLLWTLKPPGYFPTLHIGVRSSKSGKLMACITGVPARVRAYDHTMRMIEINFLCVHKKLRDKRLAPVLIKEIVRRIAGLEVYQAVYTAGASLPGAVSEKARYYHRNLNPRKLTEVGWYPPKKTTTLARMNKLYRLPSETSTPNLRPMTKADVPSAHRLFDRHARKFKLAPAMTEEEFAHALLPREGVLDSYVAVCPEMGEVTDLCSFYHLPYNIIGHPMHDKLVTAYSFYNVATTVSLADLVKDCLVLAQKVGSDVFISLDVMENESFMEDLKFVKGQGGVHYYLYNWACPIMGSSDVGLVLI